MQECYYFRTRFCFVNEDRREGLEFPQLKRGEAASRGNGGAQADTNNATNHSNECAPLPSLAMAAEGSSGSGGGSITEVQSISIGYPLVLAYSARLNMTILPSPLPPP